MKSASVGYSMIASNAIRDRQKSEGVNARSSSRNTRDSGRGQSLRPKQYISAVPTNQLSKLGGFPGAHVRRSVGAAAALGEAVEDQRAGGLREQGELAERVLSLFERSFRPHAEEHDPLKAQGPVLNLADVLELGR